MTASELTKHVLLLRFGPMGEAKISEKLVSACAKSIAQKRVQVLLSLMALVLTQHAL